MKRDGLDLDTLKDFSYKTSLESSLNKTLRRVEKSILLEDVNKALEWYDEFDYSRYNKVGIDYRVKSVSSSIRKYNRYIDAGKPI